jgi:meso-butanediol dehydrogenase/(S,S)-butanediol dehydrogenase/diacetyl reductase
MTGVMARRHGALMAGRLEGHGAIVTGAASGFGAEIARAYVAEGAHVAMLDRDPHVVDGAEALAAESGGTAVGYVVDVTDEHALEGTFTDAAAQLGAVTIVVNNAGIIGGGWIDEVDSTAHLRRLLEVNVVGVWNGCREAIRLMRGRGGSIINTGSIAAVLATPGVPAYGLAKAAVVHVTRSLAIGHGRDGIRVNAVLPGPSPTNIFRESGLSRDDLEARYLDRFALGRMTTPNDIANAMVFLASDEASFVTGAVLNVDGGYH